MYPLFNIIYFQDFTSAFISLYYFDYDQVHLLVKEAPVPLIEKLIVKGADPNAVEQSTFTPLHLAARANRYGSERSNSEMRRRRSEDE